MSPWELCRVLIVDDEILIRQGIKHYINWEREGFLIVGEASNGQEALELIESSDPHIIITDIVMPIMDGEELTRIVKANYPQIEVIVLSSFGEFDYVRSTFQSGVADYILKPKLEAEGLLKVLKATASRIPSLLFTEKEKEFNLSIEHIIDKLISGYEAEYDPAIVSGAFPHSHYCLLGVDFKNRPPSGTGKHPSYLKEKIEAALHADLAQAVYYSLNPNPHAIVFLLNVDMGEMDNVIQFARKITDLITESEPDVGFVLSEAFKDFNQVGIVYKESLLKLLQYRFYFPDRGLLIQRELPKPSPKCDIFNLNGFTEEFKRERFDSAFGYLQEHVMTLSGCYTMDVFELKSFLGNIIFNITVLLGNMDYDNKELEDAKYSYFKSIDEARQAGEAVEQLNRFIAEANKCITSKINQPGNQNMKKLLEYIEDHYTEPLSLTEVAKYFHFNPSYLSSYFAAHNNEGFIEYVNKIRTEKAAELLLKDDASISEISGMVGYSDHSYFCKVFKRITRLSPSQYRKQHLR